MNSFETLFFMCSLTHRSKGMTVDQEKSFCLSFLGLTADFFAISAPAETPVESYWSTVYNWFWEHATSAGLRGLNKRRIMWLPRTTIWAFADCSLTHTRSLPEWECEPDYHQSHHVFLHWVVEALHEVQIDLQESVMEGRFITRLHCDGGRKWKIPVKRDLLRELLPLL